MGESNGRLFKFEGHETDYIAAENETHARDLLKRHYGIDDSDIEGSYETICEVDPTTVEVYPDGWNYEDDEAEPPSAAEFMAKPGLVCSTFDQ